MRWLMQFAGFRERLLADDLFLAKLAMECGVGFFTQTAAEYERRRENFFNKLEVVFADVVIILLCLFFYWCCFSWSMSDRRNDLNLTIRNCAIVRRQRRLKKN
ncbi:hypothetical protein Bca52824_059039 [Brassica carinata]|uniref:Uncharacterized protein n=1 Tax=Brassica carinata TaxID=52824 RepID=A0A8X7QTL7_BRACI|nr:hypothetical protein Bca52824_059039 [Brassica carinata]